jgi:hypothetical protein
VGCDRGRLGALFDLATRAGLKVEVTIAEDGKKAKRNAA